LPGKKASSAFLKKGAAKTFVNLAEVLKPPRGKNDIDTVMPAQAGIHDF
jgi:hypothetical protein